MIHAQLIRAVVVSAGLVSLPIAIGSTRSPVEWNTAFCSEVEGVRCCPQLYSMCYPEGCNDTICGEEHHYARFDADSCDAP